MAPPLVIEVVGWLAGTWLLWRVPRPGPADPDGGDPPVAVVVPARNEASSLPVLLDSLTTQRPPPAEIVVVDDHSDDGTAEVAARWAPAGVRLVTAPALPPGWNGKPWACATGAASTRAPVIVFLDADVEVAPGGLVRLAAEHRRRGGLLSIQPYHHTERPYEGLSGVANVVSMMGTGAFTPRRRRRPSGAFGPCLIVGRDDYERLGGHEAVRSSVMEDIALCHQAQRAHLPVTVLGGRGVVSFRMYPGGVAQLVEGWARGLAFGAAKVRPVTLALVTAWLAAGTSAALGLVAAAASSGTGGRSLLLDGAAYGAFALQLGWMLRRVGRFRAVTWVVYPVVVAAFVALFALSLFEVVVRRRVRWKGRRVPVPR